MDLIKLAHNLWRLQRTLLKESDTDADAVHIGLIDLVKKSGSKIMPYRSLPPTARAARR